MGAIEDRIKSLGYTLPDAATPVANYVTTVHVKGAGLVFTSGHVPRTADGGFWSGTLGVDISIDEAYKAAQNSVLGILGSLKNELGDLDRITRVVKLLCLVNSAPDFTDHPLVANGASDLLVEIFGDKGRHARSAVGLSALPGNVCIEVEMVVEVS
jgi:enamine deaminase RidA (YjgF/YER057c/UK114 family)